MGVNAGVVVLDGVGLPPDMLRLMERAPDSAGQTRESLRNALSRTVRPFQRLYDAGKVRIAQSLSEVPDRAARRSGTQGYFDPETEEVWLVADEIAPGTERGVFYHESSHASGVRAPDLKTILGVRFDRLTAQLNRLVDEQDSAALRAVTRVPSDTPNSAVAEERLTYLVEDVVNTPVDERAGKFSARVRTLVQEIVAQIRAWYYKTPFAQAMERRGVTMKLNPQDVAALARQAARQWAREGTARPRDGASKEPAMASRTLDALAEATVIRDVSTFAEAREAAQVFKGAPLTNRDSGITAVVSGNSLGKMLNRKAVEKSESPEGHALAVANLDQLYERAIYGWNKPDQVGDPNVRAVHRFFAPIVHNGRAQLAKITVKETARADQPNPLYTLESVEFNEKRPAASWVDSTVLSDGVDPTSIRSARRIQTIAQQVQDLNTEGRVPTDPGSPNILYSVRADGIQDPETLKANGAFELGSLAAKKPSRGGIAKNFVRRNLTARGDLPPLVFAAKIKRDGQVNSILRRAEYNRRDLKRAMREVYGQSPSTRQLEVVDQALKSAIPLEWLPEQLQQPVKRLREHIDQLSERMIDLGVVEGDLAATLAKNMGVYATRSYRVFDDPKWAASMRLRQLAADNCVL